VKLKFCTYKQCSPFPTSSSHWGPLIYFLSLWLLSTLTFSPSIIPQGSLRLQQTAETPFLPMMHDTTFCLPIHLLRSIWFASTFWLLWIMTMDIKYLKSLLLLLWYTTRSAIAGSYGYVFFFKEPTYSLPWWLLHFIFPEQCIRKDSKLFTSLSTLVIFCLFFWLSWNEC
jgi:hypothetical protein